MPSGRLKRSGIIKLEQGEILFNEDDPAQSLFIIQKGQIRLFRPKGKGYVELAILRSGEVLGEMAFFDEQRGSRRSCSAESLVSTEIIEVSFTAFGKAIENLNPWFKTIITTLANRLRKTNAKVKQLESNSVSGSYAGGTKEYQFFQNIDIVRILSSFFLVFQSHGEDKEGSKAIHANTLKFYGVEIYNLKEVKIDAFIGILKDLGTLKIEEDKDGMPKILTVRDSQVFRTLLVFFNTERTLSNEKRLMISSKCELFLERILKQLEENGTSSETAVAHIGPIMKEFKDRNVIIDEDDLADAIKAGIVTEPVINKANEVTVDVKFNLLKKKLSCIKHMNAISKYNQSKSGNGL